MFLPKEKILHPRNVLTGRNNALTSLCLSPSSHQEPLMWNFVFSHTGDAIPWRHRRSLPDHVIRDKVPRRPQLTVGSAGLELVRETSLCRSLRASVGKYDAKKKTQIEINSAGNGLHLLHVSVALCEVTLLLWTASL